MLFIILLLPAVFAGGYFAFRYILLVHALKEITKDLWEIQADLTQNQMLRLPIPDRNLGSLLDAFNTALKAIQKERCTYEKREKEFRNQIEQISHDLRTPLTVILGYLKLYKSYHYDRIATDAELAEAIRIIGHKAEIMSDLVTQFYDYSRLSADDYSLSIQKTDMSRILRESFMGNCQILEQAHLKIEPEFLDYPVWAWADPSALERIFQNLFQNAARYADTCLKIAIRTCGTQVSVTFANDTKMLTPEDVPHLFERFYMQDQARNQGGTGLGLTVAKKLAEEMGGRLDAAAQETDAAVRKTDGAGQGETKMWICFELRLKADES